MKRDEFLKDIWDSYPAAPTGEGWRVGRWNRKGQSFELRSHGRKAAFSAQIPTKADILFCREAVETADFVACLRPGDWVAYRPQPESLGLIAPQLGTAAGEASFGFGGRGPLSRTIFEFENFKDLLRGHFQKQGFANLKTPTLVPSPGTEVFLDLFSTEFSRGQERRPLYLPTSPELHLKKALALGEELVFELRAVFRNGEVTPKHQPEFHMLEWYRAWTGLDTIKADCMRLVRELAGDEALAFASVSVHELFGQLGLDLRPDTTREELQAWCRRLGVHATEDDLWDDLFYRIFVDRVEPHLPSAHPLFVEKYPPSQAALARVGTDGWAERFELYWRGLEIANAYHELNDPVEQRRRSAQDNETRRKLGRPPVALDEEFFAALESGMLPSAGIALGVERLFMALTGISEIADLSAFPMRS